MNRKELWEDRMKFVNNVTKELSATACAYKLTVGCEVIEKDPFRGLDGSVVPYGKPHKKRRGKTVTFSKFHGALRDKMVVDTEMSQDIWDAWIEGDDYLNTITDPGFQFTEESFLSTEFFLITELYRTAGPEGDPKIDLAMMKALFHAGKMIEWMRNEGKTRSGNPSKAGSTKWKNKIDSQAVIEEAYRINTSGKKKEEIAREIQAVFIKRGKKKDEVYSTKQIIRFLKNEWHKIL